MRSFIDQLLDKSAAFAAVLFALTLGASTGFAKGGAGSFGGGGNLDEDAPVSFAEFQAQARAAAGMLPAVFRRLEVDFPASSELHAKLFKAGAVQNVLTQVQWRFDSPGACFNPEGEPRDASALITSTGRIVCLSYERLNSSLTSANAASKLTSLLAHEVSHLVGTGEDEAITIERIVKARVSTATMTLYPSLRADIASSLQDLILFLESDLATQTPNAIGSSTLAVGQWLQRASNAPLGLQFISKDDLYRAQAQLMMLKAHGTRGLTTKADWSALLTVLKLIKI